MASWSELEAAAEDLGEAGRKLLINCAPEWGIALLGTTRRDGSPRIGPLCTYILEGRFFVTVEGQKEEDLRRDPRYFLHSHWGDDQDECALIGEARSPAAAAERDHLIRLAPRIRHSPVIRELDITSAYAVTYRNFPRPDMYAEVVRWTEGEGVRRWIRPDGAPPEDLAHADPVSPELP
jgi:hypothetical protein